MKNATKKIGQLAAVVLATISFSAMAQQPMQYFRPNNQNGVNTFETTKTDTTPFKKMSVHVGGNFEQSFQSLRDYNTAAYATQPGVTGSTTTLIPLTNGFDLAMANLNIDAQLGDGIRVSLTTYLASRHHEDAWVKGGYIQFDKMLFLNSDVVNNIMKYVTIKAGQFDVDYGDQHYQRTDGGNTIYNPFIENYIMDEFATEIGGEIYYHSKCGLFAMGGITNGELDPTIVRASKLDSATGKVNKYDPAFHGKIGYDKQLNKDFRVRVTGSFYVDKSAASNTLFGGDRTGSHYYDVMSNQNVANATTLSNANDYNPFSGRLNPGYSEQVNAAMFNLFLKCKGLQFFGTYEVAQGRTITEKTMRNTTQYAADLVYRFTKKEKLWVGVRYNSVTADIMNNAPGNITINRAAASAGWFVTKNIMAKVEYVDQKYMNYASTNILNGGEFKGWMGEASVAF